MYYFSGLGDLSLSFRSDNSDQFLEIPSHNQRNGRFEICRTPIASSKHVHGSRTINNDPKKLDIFDYNT